jgi:predicted DNA-binding protein
MKSVLLNVRVPENLSNRLNEESMDLGVNLSEILRTIIANHFDVELQEDEIYNSNKFIYLLSWILAKKGQPQDHSEKETLVDLKNIVLEVLKDNQLPEHLIEEFEKLLFDLQRFITAFGTENNQFRFCVLYQEDTFDYTGLIDYIAYKAFENRIQL